MIRLQAVSAFFLISTLGLILGKVFSLLNLPTFTPDLIGLGLIIFICSKISYLKFPRNSFPNFFFIFLILSLIFCSIKAATSSNLISALSSIYRIILIQILVLVGYTTTETKFNAVLKQQSKLLVIISIIAIIQFVFWDYLPRYLISPSLVDNHVDGVAVGNIKGIRVNGLFGNPLELMAYSSILLFLFNKNIILKSLTILFTLSRTGIILLFLRFFSKSYIILIFIASVLIYYLSISSINLGLFSRLLFSTEESSQSTSSRLNYISHLSDFNSTDLLYGIDLGSISARSRSNKSVEIYDGFFLNIIAEYGLIYFLIYASMIFYILYKTTRKNYTKWINANCGLSNFRPNWQHATSYYCRRSNLSLIRLFFKT
jgi:hypothetical protein